MAQPKFFNTTTGQWEPLTVGVTGPTGPQGATGARGPQGIQGVQGSANGIMIPRRLNNVQTYIYPPLPANENRVVGAPGRVVFIPLYPGMDTTISELFVFVAIAGEAGDTARVALYEFDPTDPFDLGELLSETGDVDISSSGLKVGSCAPVNIVVGKTYWAALITTGTTAGFRSYNNNGIRSFFTGFSANGETQRAGRYSTLTHGPAFPTRSELGTNIGTSWTAQFCGHGIVVY